MEVLNPYAFLKNEGTGFCWFGEIDVTADELMSGVNDTKDESKKFKVFEFEHFKSSIIG